MKFPTIKEMAEEVAEKALDEFEYKGKTLRQWIEIISASELGTNLAEVGTDCISRADAIEVIERARAHIGHNMERAVGRVFLEMLDDVGLSISKLPPIQPEPHWIPVTERLPKEEGFYIVTLEHRYGAETNIRFFKIENGETLLELIGK